MVKSSRILASILCVAAVSQTSAATDPYPIIPPLIASSPEVEANWAATLARIASGVVTIQIDATRAFDTEWNTTAQATGFVVDAKRGLILTNRHVVTPGPVVAQATFQNREEVQLFPVYRDPVHDFGIYRYDPSKLKFIKPAELPLYPEGAVIGREIRVVGNDAGEQLSILAGTLARLDREAPEYGYGKYNDFNTFYFQAASSTSGGSSGSPVIDIEGRVVALNAGGATGAASSFYLPLTQVTRALNLIKQGKPVPRGTLGTVFKYTPFDELRRLGLDAESEARMRRDFPHLTGMLVVTEVQPGSQADGLLAPGDILLGIDGKPVPEFFALAEVIDSRVGRQLKVEVNRGGDKIERALEVIDLDSITPDEYIEFGEAVVHTLSYQQARHFNAPVKGVYVANPGYIFSSAGIPRAALITSLNGMPTPRLEEFERALAGLADGARAAVKYLLLEDPRAQQVGVIRMDRRWFPARKCKRDDQTGVWPCKPLAAGPSPASAPPASTRFAKTGDPRIDKLSPSLVLVTFDMPYSVSGVTEKNYHGTGLIVDSRRGLIVVDRNTVPVAIGDVRLTFGGTVEVPGRVEFIHPLHNLAVVSYDPKALDDTPVQAARLSARELSPGEDVYVVGLRADSKVMSQRTQVAGVDVVPFPLSRTLRFRESNLETISLVNAPNDFDGVLTNAKGEVEALWSSFAFETGREIQQENRGVPTDLVQEMIRAHTTGRGLFSMEAEFDVRSLAGARKLGLSDFWVKKFEEHSPQRRQVLSIDRLVAASPAAQSLEPGDLLLAIDGKVVNRFREVERAVQKPHITVTVLRDGAERQVELNTATLNGRDIDRVLIWAGATLQAPHRDIAAQRGIAPDGVFVSFFYYGSPATRYGLYAGRRITEVDGQPIRDLDAFIAAVRDKSERQSLRLKTVSWNGQVEVITLRLDKHYWPSYEIIRQPDGQWVRHSLDADDALVAAQ
jgi:pro-apoptotic serine protease NMA111